MTSKMTKLSDYSKTFQNIDNKKYTKHEKILSDDYEKLRTLNEIKIIKKYIKYKYILEHAVGTGRIYECLEKKKNIWAADISKINIQNLKKKYPSHSSNFFVSPLENIKIKKKFDTILSFRVMNRILIMDDVFFQIRKLLKVNGLWLFNFDPKRIKEVDSLSQKYGFSIEECFMYDFWAFNVEFNIVERIIFKILEKINLLNKYTFPIFEMLYCYILKRGRNMFLVLKKK